MDLRDARREAFVERTAVWWRRETAPLFLEVIAVEEWSWGVELERKRE